MALNTGPTRAEHLAWAKARAKEYLDAGDGATAYASFTSDLNKHPLTAGHAGVELGMMQIMAGLLNPSDVPAMRKWIDGFN